LVQLIPVGVGTKNQRAGEDQQQFHSQSVSRYSDGLEGRGSIPSKGKMFLFSTAFRPAPGPTQPPIKWVSGLFPRGVKRQGCVNEHFHLVPRLRMVELYLHSMGAKRLFNRISGSGTNILRTVGLRHVYIPEWMVALELCSSQLLCSVFNIF
jgi:hypothetical protein